MPTVVDQAFDEAFADRRDRLLAVARQRLQAETAEVRAVGEWLDQEHVEGAVRAALERQLKLRKHKTKGSPEPPEPSWPAPTAVSGRVETSLSGDSLRADRLQHALCALLQQNRQGELTRLLGPNLPRGQRERNALRALVVSAMILDPDADEWLARITLLAGCPWIGDAAARPPIKGRSDVCRRWSGAAVMLLDEACWVLGWHPDQETEPRSEASGGRIWFDDDGHLRTQGRPALSALLAELESHLERFLARVEACGQAGESYLMRDPRAGTLRGVSILWGNVLLLAWAARVQTFGPLNVLKEASGARVGTLEPIREWHPLSDLLGQLTFAILYEGGEFPSEVASSDVSKIRRLAVEIGPYRDLAERQEAPLASSQPPAAAMGRAPAEEVVAPLLASVARLQSHLSGLSGIAPSLAQARLAAPKIAIPRLDVDFTAGVRSMLDAAEISRREVLNQAYPPGDFEFHDIDPAEPADVRSSGVATGRSWQDVQADLLGKRERGEPFPGQRALAKDLECSSSTVAKAIKNSPTLRGWQKRAESPTKAPAAESLSAPVVESTRSEESPADEVLTSDEVDSILAKLIDAAGPEYQAELNSLNEEGRRRIAAIYSQSPDWEPSPLEPDRPGKARRGPVHHKRA